MNTNVGLLLAIGLAIGGGDAAREKKEIEKLQGTWSVSELTYNGKDHSKLKFNFVFKGNEAVVEGDDKIKVEYARIKVKVDPTTMPKLFDITVAGGTQKDAVMEGIYEFKGEELRICAKVFGKDRPAEFASPDGSSIVLMVLKRAKQ
jgi:uncharacterized protein (TIGR03067 family)